MGEHERDETIDEILDKENYQQAKELAEQEAERLRLEVRKGCVKMNSRSFQKEAALKLTLARVHSRSGSQSAQDSGELSPTPGIASDPVLDATTECKVDYFVLL